MKYLILIALALIIHLLPAQGDYTQIQGSTANQGNFAATDLGDTARNRNAIGEFDSHSKAMLFPRLTTTQQNAISSPANGMFIYNTDSLKVCWYTGAAWVCSSTGGAPAGNYWGVNGNTGLSWGKFLGTTDTNSFQIKVNNIKSGIIDINNGNTSFGFETLNSSTGTNANNTAIGYLNNSSLTTGGNNVSLGSNCLTDNTTGSNNVAIGYDAQLNSTTAIENTSIGTGAGATIVTGSGNTVVGYGTDVYLSNTLMGTAIGFEAVAFDNSVSLGNYAGGAVNALNLSSYIDSIRCPGMPTGIGYGLFDVHGDGYLTLQSIPYPTGAYWNIGGNTGSNTSTNYIGTTDNHSLLFKTNSVPVMWLDSATQYVGIGTTIPKYKVDILGGFRDSFITTSGVGVIIETSNNILGYGSSGVALLYGGPIPSAGIFTGLAIGNLIGLGKMDSSILMGAKGIINIHAYGADNIPNNTTIDIYAQDISGGDSSWARIRSDDTLWIGEPVGGYSLTQSGGVNGQVLTTTGASTSFQYPLNTAALSALPIYTTPTLAHAGLGTGVAYKLSISIGGVACILLAVSP